MKKKDIGRIVGWLGLVLIVAAATVWGLWPQPIPVQLGEVARGDLTAAVRGEARARVRDLYVVSAPVDGELVRIDLKPGAKVEVGDVVARIKPLHPRLLDDRSYSEAIAAVASARAAVERADAAEKEAEVAVEHAQSLLATAKKLAESSSGSEKDVEHAAHELKMQEDALDAAKASARLARSELDRALAVIGANPDDKTDAALEVKAPTAGEVLRVVRESAGPIASGMPLIEIGDVGRLEIVADLLSRDAAAVKVGANATITKWGPGKPLAARVRRVDQAAYTKVSALGLEEQRADVVLDLTAPPPPGLGHDYRVDVSIETWSGKDVLRVPSTALFRSGNRWAVFVVNDGKARLVEVELGATDGHWTVVNEGLDDGDQVVIQPTDQLTDGTAVEAAP